MIFLVYSYLFIFAPRLRCRTFFAPPFSYVYRCSFVSTHSTRIEAWSESRMSALEKRVGASNEKTVDGNAWVKGAKEKGGEKPAASNGHEKQLVANGSDFKASTAATADLLDHSEPDPPPPPRPPAAAPAAPPPAPAAAAASASGAGGTGGEGTVGISQEALPLMKGWFNGLVLAPQGVLFEDAHLQVFPMHLYIRASGGWRA